MKVKGRIQILIKVTNRIRIWIRIKVMRIRNTVKMDGCYRVRNELEGGTNSGSAAFYADPVCLKLLLLRRSLR
jgi:hypothetical protein